MSEGGSSAAGPSPDNRRTVCALRCPLRWLRHMLHCVARTTDYFAIAIETLGSEERDVLYNLIIICHDFAV